MTHQGQQLPPIFMPGLMVQYAGQQWKVGMVGRTGDERYYWLVRGKDVAMVPAFILAQDQGQIPAEQEQ